MVSLECASDPGWQFLRQSMEQIIADQTKPFDGKKSCWIPDDEEGFIDAEIKSTKGDQVTVFTSKGNEKTLKKELVQEMNPPKFEKTEDMANLTYLNEASVLHNLRQRYYVMMIYTYSGLFCVVINPYKRLPIYTESVVKMFIGKRRNEMPPHLFAVADEAYRNMVQDRENQSMLITGESGAGKTENTKKVIAYFAVVGATQEAEASSKKGGDGKKSATLEEQIVRTNPVLEAFGNAKTVRNNNSSRFGKFIRVHFSKSGKLAGGDIEHYLLEKSRVIRQAPGERSYHIYYQIMSGEIKDLRKKLALTKDLKYYHCCSQAELTIDGVDDKEEMRMTHESFDVMGFSDEEQVNLYKMVAAIMHMGEMKFKQRPREEQAESDGMEDAENAALNFEVSGEDIIKALLKPRVRVGNEWVNKGQNIDQVHWAVGALSKAVYARMFHWLIKRCNKTLDAKDFERRYFIGVLDIAGFEIFDLNSFEQMWINFVNEKLQQFFNHHMFVLEQEEYKREGINWTFIDFGLDLQACIELIERPLGIISMLDEECIVPKATDMTFVQKLNDQHLGKHPNLVKPRPPKGKQAEAHFACVHYAGTVRYNVNNWLEKNKDPLNDTAVSCLKGSPNTLLQALWADYQTQEEAAEAIKAGGSGKKKGKSASFQTVSMMYRESLTNLMHMLHQTHPHFIRCIIPNELKKSGMIDAALVLNQLTCNGVLEGIRICRKGFPNRIQYPDFKQRYAILAADEAKSDDAKAASVAMLEKISVVATDVLAEADYRVGETKVFFRAGVLGRLEDFRDVTLSRLMTGFQARCRWWLGIREAQKRREQMAGYTILQKNIRSWVALRNWAWFSLYGRVKPLLKSAKIGEEMDKLNDRIKKLEEDLGKEEKVRKDMEDQNSKLLAEKNELYLQLQGEKGSLSDLENKLSKLEAQKRDLEKQVTELNDRLADQEDKNTDVSKAKKKLEHQLDELKKKVQELEMQIRKLESEKQSRDNQIKSLQEEMAQQDELIAKLNKEKKHQEEVNRKLMDDLQAEEDKVNHLNKVKTKLEQTLDELEDSLEREKRGRQDLEKSKRKIDGELKIATENMEENNRQKHDVENNLKKKEQELHALGGKLEDEQSLVARLQKQIKELQSRVTELEEELDAERQARARVEKGKSDLQREIEEMSERLEEAGGSTAAQIELNKKREAELSKLRRDLEEANMNHESQLGGLRKKHNDAIAELGDQMDQLQKTKAKIDKDKAQLAREIEDLHSALDQENKVRQDTEKQCKNLELQLTESSAKCDEQGRQLGEFSSLKSRLNSENGDLLRQLEDSESQASGLGRLKSQLQSQLEEARRSADEEARDKQNMAAQLRNSQHENDSLREQVEEEAEAKAELQRQLSKANGEIQQWKARFESEGLAKVDEIEEAKRKLLQRVSEYQEQMEQANLKLNSSEKMRHKLLGELDDAQVDVERANSYATSMEKKQKEFDRIIDGWKKKVDDLNAEMDNCQRENRTLGTEVFKLKNGYDEVMEQLEGVRRENKNLSQEIKDLTDQLSEGGRSVHELQKMVRRLEMEKEELQGALDEAEAALEAEESKVLRAQVEVSQIRQEIEKRIQEKEEEFENTRKNHQRALDSMQVTLEAEAKGRAEAMRLKKKLESDINELEIALDHANKANADAQKNLKKYQEQIREIQFQLEDEQRQKDDLREQFNTSEKRCAILQGEKEEAYAAAEQGDRARRQAEAESQDARETANELSAQAASLNSIKRKLEGELQALHSELDDSINEAKAADERANKAATDASRLADELRQEQEHSMHIERMRKGLETQLKEMQVRLDEAEAAALKGGKKVIQKLELRVREVEQELDAENRRYQDSEKHNRTMDRRIKELEFQSDESKKNEDRMAELIDKLQGKIKTYKRQVEEAEELAAANLAKYRQLQQQVEDAEERAEMAENSLSKLRAKNRSSASLGPGAISTSVSSAAIMRSSSRSRGFDF
jgi:myosin heavy subunit